MSRTSGIFRIGLVLSLLGFSELGYGMGLRSFVALPVEKKGAVLRVATESIQKAETNVLKVSMAYGFNVKQTFLFGIPYRISPGGGDRQGDLSLLFRQIIHQEDRFSGTTRFALLGGAILPTETSRDAAIQGGFVFTHVNNRHEFDIDALFQSGQEDRQDSGRYDMSWQYRVSPKERSEWGLSRELNTVLELGGRWREENNVTHQITVGLQLIHQKVVIEGGVTRDLNNDKDLRFLVSMRFHL